jgi:threonine synthase
MTYGSNSGISHTGSFKDLGMTVLVSAVNHIIVTGQTPVRGGCINRDTWPLGRLRRNSGIPTIVFLPKGKITTAQLIQPIAHGARPGAGHGLRCACKLSGGDPGRFDLPC